MLFTKELWHLLVILSIYLDDLFSILTNSGLGSHFGPYFYGVQGYEDDCVLLNPDHYGLQKIMDICKSYFDNHKIDISTNVILSKSKSKCIIFGSNEVPVQISIL